MSRWLMEEIGCIPIYLKAFLTNTTDYEICHAPLKLKQAHKIFDHIKKIVDHFDKPCDEMLVLSIESINNNPTPMPNDISVKFVYAEKVYEEIQYIEAIGFNSWLSNVGGFVGIFLGYSMMQVPEFLLLFVNSFDRRRKNVLAGSILKL